MIRAFYDMELFYALEYTFLEGAYRFDNEMTTLELICQLYRYLPLRHPVEHVLKLRDNQLHVFGNRFAHRIS